MAPAWRQLVRRRTPGKGHWKPPFYIGALALEGGDEQQAIEYLTVAEARFPMNGIISYFLGRAYEAAGNERAAREAYQRARENLPEGSQLRDETRARLRALS